MFDVKAKTIKRIREKQNYIYIEIEKVKREARLFRCERPQSGRYVRNGRVVRTDQVIKRVLDLMDG